MEFNELKTAWNEVEIPAKTTEEIKLMLQENRHPVLKGIRKQVIMELIGWSVFLVCYYTMFDGGHKPLWVNALLVLSVLFPLIHNLMSYGFAKYLIKGNTIRESVSNYLSNVKMYAGVSVISRLVFASGLLLFLTYGIQFNEAKYISLGAIILLFLVQLGLLVNLWIKRLNKLNAIVTDLN